GSGRHRWWRVASRRGPAAGRRLAAGPLFAPCSLLRGGLVGGLALLLSAVVRFVGRGRSGRGPARRVIHRRSVGCSLTGRGVRGGWMSAIVPRWVPPCAGHWERSGTSIVGGAQGKLGGWLISIRCPRKAPYLPPPWRCAGRSPRRGPYWYFS